MKKILVADDDKGLSELIKDALEAELDAEVLVFDDGISSASEVLSRKLFGIEDFDLIITDFQMPGMNGRELMKNLRENQYAGPILLITGKADKNGIAKMELEFDAVTLTKPASMEQIIAKVKRILDLDSAMAA